MFQNIVVPLDLTDRHQAALRNAAELVVPGGAISLVHVIETIAGLSRDEEKEFYTRLENNARVHLDRWGRDLDERRISWRAEVRYGDRALESVRYAQESGADLLILTAPRIDPDNPRGGWGSMSYKISVLSQCPVLLVK